MTAGGRSKARWQRARAAAAVLPASLVVVVVALAALAGLLFWAAATYTIVDEGELVPWDVGPIYEVEIFGRVTFYADGETARAGDAVSGILLAATAGVAFLTYVLLLQRSHAADGRARLCFLLATVGAGWLAFDEFAGIHETVGLNLPFLADLPGIERPDDALFLLYAVPAAVFLAAFRHVLFASRGVSALLVAGIALTGVGAILDVGGRYVEELAEPLSAMLILAGFLLLSVRRIEAPASRR